MAGTDAAEEAGPALPVRHKGLLTVGIMLAMMMQVLDTTVANVALPHMQASLGATIDSVTWVLSSYMVASAIAIPITGWLADRIGSRLLFLVAVTGFVIASMLCGIATSLEEMVIFRVIQGAAGAFIAPLSQSALLDINPREKHGQAMAIWSLGAVIGPIIGPIVGGWLTEYYNWRWVFYINLPFGALTFTMLFFLLPSHPVRRRGFDAFGFAMLALGLAALQLLLDRGQQLDWFDSEQIWLMLGISVIGFWVFIVHMFFGRNTIISRGLFRDRNYVATLVFSFLVGVVVFAVSALMPPLLQTVYGYPVIDAGLLLALRGIGVVMSMAIAAQLINRTDPRIILALGFAIAAWSLYLMTGFSIEMDYWPIVTTGLIQGFGIGFVLVPLNVIAFATLPQRLRAEAASMLNLVRNIGASLGISIGAANLANMLQTSHADLAAHVTPYTLPAIPVETFGQYEPAGETMLAMIDAEVTRQALMIAYIDDFWLMMAAMVLVIPPLLLVRRVPTAPPAPG